MLAFHLVSCQGSKVEFEQSIIWRFANFLPDNLKDILALKCGNTACKKNPNDTWFLVEFNTCHLIF